MSARGQVRVALAVLDMAGTTIADGGAVEAAFVSAIGTLGIGRANPRLPAMLDYVRTTMGQSKLGVFRHLLEGDERAAQRANLEFENAYARSLAGGRCSPVPGALGAIRQLRAAGIKVALTTGFSTATQCAIIDTVGWQNEIDLALAPPEAGRGRPYPDLVLTALLRLGVEDVRALAVAGDTRSDVLSGVRSGARVVAGVLTGADDAPSLLEAGATHVLPTVASLPAVLIDSRAVHRRTSEED